MTSLPDYFSGPVLQEYKQCENAIWTYIVIGIESLVIVLLIAWLVFQKCYTNRNMQMVPLALDNNLIKMNQTSDQTDNDYEEVVMIQNNNCTATQPNSNNQDRDPDARVNLIQELKQAALPRYLPMVPIYQKNQNNEQKN